MAPRKLFSTLEELHTLLGALPLALRSPQSMEPLHGGQSGVSLSLLHYDWGDAVLKGPLKAREAQFYREVAPRLADMGIAVPVVYGAIEYEQASWVLREAFPQLLPMHRWFGDEAVLRILRQLHALASDFALPDPFLPTWQELDPRYSLTLRADLAARMATLAERHATLFMPTTVIVGDPNTTNWGVRADGAVVIFDWEYIGYGAPARDLGNLIPQLGWPTLYEEIAQKYLAVDLPEPEAEQIQQLAHAMVMARLQSVIAYINAPEIVEENRQFVLGLLPSWITMIEQWDQAHHRQFG